MGYRNPMYLAKVAATVDIVSGGRTEMGIGAGWYEHEWNAYGYGFPPAGDRIAMLAEGVEIMRQAWEKGVATYAGEHYQVDGAICRPTPLQEGGIPLWIAGGGEKVTLRIAAKYADYTNYAPGSLEEFNHKSELLKQHCADVGRDYSEIVRTTNSNICIGRDEREVRDRLEATRARLLQAGVPQSQVDKNIHELENSQGCGTPEQVVERLKHWEKAGMSYLIANFNEAAFDTSGMALFEHEVIPELVDQEEHGHLWHLGRRH
jgi:alkanesulfonate monooxygenase SsuD/methylene tetrahydromethanopterin reductase-like flavin-dependent oxidoreductase (luciferase family)